MDVALSRGAALPLPAGYTEIVAATHADVAADQPQDLHPSPRICSSRHSHADDVDAYPFSPLRPLSRLLVDSSSQSIPTPPRSYTTEPPSAVTGSQSPRSRVPSPSLQSPSLAGDSAWGTNPPPSLTRATRPSRPLIEPTTAAGARAAAAAEAASPPAIVGGEIPSLSPSPSPTPSPSLSFSPSPSPAPASSPAPAPGPLLGPLFSPAPSPAPSPSFLARSSCAGVLVDYRIKQLRPIPFSGAPAFRFTAVVTVSNVGPATLPRWRMGFSFVNQESLTEVKGVALPDGVTLPVAGNSVVLSSPPTLPIVLSSVQAAGNPSLYKHNFTLIGTEVAALSPAAALPASIDLQAPGYQCSQTPVKTGHNDTLRICCDYTQAQQAVTVPQPIPILPANQQGLSVQWDVVSANASMYKVLVHVSNTQRYTNISSDPGWSLQWAWQMGEMIVSCDGCQALTVGDCSSCSGSLASPTVRNPYSCDPRPTIVDGTALNGSLVGPAYDQAASTTSFTMLLAKGRAFWDASLLTLPANITVIVTNDSFSPAFVCDPPQALQPTAVQTMQGSRQKALAKASYSITCGPAPNAYYHPYCCISASAFYNDTLSPCTSCVCGCNSSLPLIQDGGQCDASTSAYSDPAATILLGTDLAGLQVPGADDAGRCSSGCGVQVHVTVPSEDEEGSGWTMRVSVANGGAEPLKDWQAVLQLPAGLSAYMDNVTGVEGRLDNPPYDNHLLVRGIPTVNEWLLGDGGNVQWSLHFNRSLSDSFPTSDGDVLQGDVFPLAVNVEGHWCQMPAFLPSKVAIMRAVSVVVYVLVVVGCVVVIV